MSEWTTPPMLYTWRLDDETRVILLRIAESLAAIERTLGKPTEPYRINDRDTTSGYSGA